MQVGPGLSFPKSDPAFPSCDLRGNRKRVFSPRRWRFEVSLTSFMNVSLALTRSGSQARARRVIAEHAEIVEAIRTKIPYGHGWRWNAHHQGAPKDDGRNDRLLIGKYIFTNHRACCNENGLMEEFLMQLDLTPVITQLPWWRSRPSR